MPSVIGLLEQRGVRAREELEWLEVLRQAQEEVAAATERAERARVAREELVQALAEEGAGGAATVPVGTGVEAGPGPAERPQQWRPGLDEEALCGLYREVRRLGRPAEKNEVEKVRHVQAGHTGTRSRRCSRRSGQRGASPARRRVSLIEAAHHTICS